MRKKLAFVSGCDANYFPMLLEWIHSIRRHPQSQEAATCIMNTGLTDDQAKQLKSLADEVVIPDWPTGMSLDKVKGREFIKSCVCRPFINHIFPGYETYLWMDADMWLQDWRGIELFVEGAQRGKLAAVLQVDRGYPRAVRIKWLGRWPWKVRNFYFSNALKSFDFKTAKILLMNHVISAGAFALRGDAPHWEKWQALMMQALKKGNPFTAEQLSMGVMTHIEGYPAEFLPAWTHWLCEFKPLWDEASQQWIEPYLPHEPITIMHLTGKDEMRLDRAVTDTFQTTTGETVEMTYRYPHYNGENQEALSEAG